LAALSALVLLPGLGSSGRLTYHEAFVAQGAREMLASGSWSHPSIGGLPWLEKPPLPWWLTAALGYCAGGVDETIARLPSAMAALTLALGIAVVASRHYGPTIGLLAGAIQATTSWTVMRGRLAEADIVLACLVTWTIVAFDQLLDGRAEPTAKSTGEWTSPWRRARWLFFALLGVLSLVKGIGFGAVMVLAVAGGVLIWRRDRLTLRRLWFPAGWMVAAVIAFAWPCAMVAQHGRGAFALWAMHIAGRVWGKPGPGPFAGEPWWEYVPVLLGQALPWTPLAAVGAWYSLRRACLGGATGGTARCGNFSFPPAVVAGDRLLWTWTALPLGLLALPAVKHAHYAISAQVPWSVWAALGAARLAARLRLWGWDQRALLRLARGGFLAVALAYGLGYWLLGPWFDRRGIEWAFYETAGHRLPSAIPLVLLYDNWDRNPYESPLGSIPHDLAVRLFYLRRPACWHFGAESLVGREHAAGHCALTIARRRTLALSHCPVGSEFAVIGRDRDLPALERLGDVEVMAHGPSVRRDRTYSLFRVTTSPPTLAAPFPVANSSIPDRYH
jgi:4-amino-4-deoxy-L-arabinose transferase-like glycosyltransferase